MTSPATALPRRPLWFRRPNTVVVTCAVLVALAAIVELITISDDSRVLGGNQAGGYAALAVTLTGVVLAWRFPWPGFLVAVAGPLVASLLGWDPIVPWNLVVFATLALTLRGLPGLPAGAIATAGNYLAVVIADGGAWGDSTATIAGAFSLAAAATGTAIRVNHQYWAELERRMHDAVTTREAEADRRVAEERLRIARDLHDSVGHEVAVVSMHLGAAEVHLPAGADTARADLASARTGVQAVLRETQQILDVLRVGHDEDALSPTAGHDRVSELVDSFRAAGLDVEADLDGLDHVPSSLSPTVSTAVYRIVQEALTNAQRHGTGSVSLRIEVTDDLQIETVNVRAAERSAQDDAPARGGHGLVGMRERAASAGGRVEATAEGTLFFVRATLPVDGGKTR